MLEYYDQEYGPDESYNYDLDNYDDEFDDDFDDDDYDDNGYNDFETYYPYLDDADII